MGLISGILERTLHSELMKEADPSGTQEEREFHKQQALEARQAMHVDRMERHRLDLLAQPGSIDTVVARGLSELMPSVKKVNYSKYPGKAEALDDTTPDDSPMKGFATRVRSNFMNKLATPGALLTDNPNELMINSVREEFASPPREGERTSTLEEAYNYKRRADSNFLQWGENKKIRKPPGYNDWVSQVRKGEDARVQKEGWIASNEDILKSAAYVGGGGAVLGMLGGPEAAVGAGITGAVVGGVGEFIAHPFKRILHGTEWYQSRAESSKLTDRMKTWAVDLGVDVAAMAGFERNVPRALASLIKYDSVAKEFMASPNSYNFLKLGKDLVRAKQSEAIVDKAFGDLSKKGAYDALVEKEFVQEWGYFDRLKASSTPASREFKSTFAQLSDDAQSDVLEKASIGTPLGEAVSRAADADRHIAAIDRVNQEVYAKSQTAERASISKKFGLAREKADDLFERRQTVFREANEGDLKAKSLAAKVRDENAARLSGVYSSEYIAQGVKDLPTSELGPEYEKWLDEKQIPLREGEEIPPASGGKLLRSLVLPIIAAGSVGIATLWPTEEAHAGVAAEIPKVLGDLAEAASKQVGKNPSLLAKLFDKMNVLRRPVDPANPFTIPTEQEVPWLGKKIEDIYGSTLNAIKRTTGLELGAHKIADPHTQAGLAYKSAAKPSFDIAMMQMVSQGNNKNAFEVVGNILKGIPEVSNEVSKATEGFVERTGADFMAMNAVDSQVKTFEQIRAGLANYGNKKGLELGVPKRWRGYIPEQYKTVDDAVEFLNSRIPMLQTARDTLEPLVNGHLGEWEGLAKDLAKKYPSSRIALAIEDTADFKRYPWLKDIMSFDEKTATARLQEVFKRYRVRADAADLNVFHDSYPYAHHAWHPAWRQEAGLSRLRELNVDFAANALPYTEFPSRGPLSRMMMPDAWYMMRSYIPDAENRIQWKQFWDIWSPHAGSDVVKTSPLLSSFWDGVKKMMVPAPNTTGNQWANRYTAFETMRLLGFMPSVGLKHIFKMAGTASQFGIGRTIKQYPEAMKYMLANSADRGFLGKLGIKGPDVDKTVLRAIQSFTETGRWSNFISDLGFPDFAEKAGLVGGFDRVLARINEKGSMFVAGAEMFDRTVSVLAAMDMANKQGMTAFQSLYGIVDSVVTNNFLSGNLNPSWLRDPKIRMLALFQGTPFKILERRLMDAYGTKRTISTAIGKFKGKDFSNILDEMKGLKRIILEGQDEFKGNIIADALSQESDFFGTPSATKFMREVLLTGTLITGGSALGLNLLPQTTHIPFIETAFSNKPQIAQPPILGAIWDTWAARRKARQEEEEPNFFPTDFLQHWMGGKLPLPSIVRKAARISDQDIPEIYKDSPMRYLFSVPATGE